MSLDGDAASATFSHSGGEADFEDWTPQITREIPEGLPYIQVSAASLDHIGHFDREIAPREHIGLDDLSAFSERELATICAGKHSDVEGMAAIIGNSASRLAGGAGETASVVAEKGYGAIVMADGPAGLRLATRYMETEDGQEGLDSDAFDSILNILLPEIQQLIRMKLRQNEEKAKNHKVLYHYASAIPIGTAIAQSWNTDLAEQCGDIVGDEMERFGVHLWLAPALNIQRDIRCGRNFEYYSEDPLLSGKFAAAVTTGVQRHPGCGTTLKHFAANNQETNRYNSNSMVSERAMREIYLRGFEIAVRESAPYALMTSYNLLNGVHTSERRDLLEDILRAEFGHKDLVMTDWIIGMVSGGKNKYPGPVSAKIAAAGNDLTMPGGPGDYKAMLAGLKDGTVSREQLEMNATRILRTALKLARKRW